MWYIECLKNKEIQFNPTRVCDMLEHRQTQSVNYWQNARGLHEQMGAEYHQPEALQARWRRWKRFLDIKHATPQEWMQSLPASLRLISSAPNLFTDAQGVLS
jgi:hypothetical protein